MTLLLLIAVLGASPDGGALCNDDLIAPVVRAHRAANKRGADGWLALQKSADDLAARLSTRKLGATAVSELQNRLNACLPEMGIRLQYCEIGSRWKAGSEGFAQSLAVAPNGPHADEAYWQTEVETRACGDFEPSVTAYRDGVQRYEAFLRRFPSSRLRSRAERQLTLYRSGLEHELAVAGADADGGR